MKPVKFLIAMLMALTAVTTAAAAKHALLAGVNSYGAASGWAAIHGADDVELFVPLLQSQGFSVTALCDSKATKPNVVQQLKRLVKAARPGDTVYIHFSCHGQCVEDLDGDEDDQWDEAVVLYGASKTYGANGYKGEQHLIDDELSLYITQIQSKIGCDGMLYVVIDACHSGKSSRGENDVRGSNATFCYSVPQKQYKIDKRKQQPQYYHLNRNGEQSHVVILEACRAWEFNREITTDSEHPAAGAMKSDAKYGSLSYYVYRCLLGTDITTDTSWASKVRECMDSDSYLNTQRMVIESTLTLP